MNDLGLAAPFWLIVIIWMARTIWLVVLCTLLAWLGVMALDALTPNMPKRELIGGNPVATGLFMGGFFILVGLVIHGSITAPTIIGGPLLQYFFDFRRLGLLGISFIVSLLVGLALFYLLDKITPKIPFSNIKSKPEAVGIYIFGYLVFYGLILHASLTTPL